MVIVKAILAPSLVPIKTIAGKPKLAKYCGLALLSFFSIASFASIAAEQQGKAEQAPLSFERAIKSAQLNDPWLSGNVHKQRAIELLSISANSLPDPKVSIGLANLPSNGFDFSQEGMTQAKFGISQMFPRGDSLAIKSEQLKLQSEAYPYQRKNRQAQVTVTVGSLWLDAYRVQQSIALIQQNRALFEQLADVAQASYSSTFGKARQQDIVRSQLELTRLEERLDKLAQQQSSYQGLLMQWLAELPNAGETQVNINSSLNKVSVNELKLGRALSRKLSKEMPKIDLLNSELVFSDKWLTPQQLVPYFSQHPAITSVDKKVSSTQTSIKLAEQKYQPEWGVNASYGYRDDDLNGNSRADLFSVGVTFDLPLFTENRQDKEVQSAIATTEAVKTEKVLLLRQLLGAFSSTKARLLGLNKRQHLYREKLIPQLHAQAEVSLTAYTNDDGDFAEVVRARIAVLNAEIDQLKLNVEEQKMRLELNYLFINDLNTVTASNMHSVSLHKQHLNSLGEQ